MVISSFKNLGSACAANPRADLKVADLALAVNAPEARASNDYATGEASNRPINGRNNFLLPSAEPIAYNAFRAAGIVKFGLFARKNG